MVYRRADVDDSGEIIAHDDNSGYLAPKFILHANGIRLLSFILVRNLCKCRTGLSEHRIELPHLGQGDEFPIIKVTCN